MQTHGSEKASSLSDARYVLALDLGSGGPKAAIVSDGGQVIASAVEKTSTYLLPGGGAEQDPEEWWQGAKKAARQAICDAGVPADKIVAVACDSQWSVVVPVDSLQPAVANELGLQSSTRVITGISDSNASIIGSGAVQDFESIMPVKNTGPFSTRFLRCFST